ncbi:unnamed protein product [Eruca vesicaria subsp. sativa]|uniref:Uncharacterized protein n=1 Tax=Eruca vesicaria subsp. sativa TaxID=29727 RepID=A0ABC8L7H3_ERUVS|nr:unnamed protein product [Eruca vesicaria subsp. sativa]
MGLGLILDSTKEDGLDPVRETGRVRGRKRSPVVNSMRDKDGKRRRVNSSLVRGLRIKTVERDTDSWCPSSDRLVRFCHLVDLGISTR